MSQRIIPLIMCGGAGTRLWPASREVRPKQFLPLFGPRSTFQDTLLRVSDAALFERPIVITNTTYRFMVLEQLAEIGLEADVLLEPMRRDSGPAIAAGAAFAQTRDKDAVVLALAWLFMPGHLFVFFDRLLFGSQHYPTQTRIVSLRINGKAVALPSGKEGAVHVGYGQPVRFEVTCEGARPPSRVLDKTSGFRL